MPRGAAGMQRHEKERRPLERASLLNLLLRHLQVIRHSSPTVGVIHKVCWTWLPRVVAGCGTVFGIASTVGVSERRHGHRHSHRRHARAPISLISTKKDSTVYLTSLDAERELWGKQRSGAPREVPESPKQRSPASPFFAGPSDRISFAALSGELAMPCTCDRLAGPRSPPEAARVRLKPVTAALKARSRAMRPREPCQGREAAALSG